MNTETKRKIDFITSRFTKPTRKGTLSHDYLNELHQPTFSSVASELLDNYAPYVIALLVYIGVLITGFTL